MDKLVGPKASEYLSKDGFEQHEVRCREGSLGVFDAMATMGRRSESLRVRSILLEELDDAKIRCVTRAPTSRGSILADTQSYADATWFRIGPRAHLAVVVRLDFISFSQDDLHMVMFQRRFSRSSVP